MTLAGDQCRFAELRGGPVDGQVEPLDPTTDQLLVVLTDGQRHTYKRTSEHTEVLNGQEAAVFQWSGRNYGLK
jgi:hypothetical protein